MQHEPVLEQHVFALGSLHVEAEPLQLALAVGPVLAHLDPELEMHALAEQLRAARAALRVPACFSTLPALPITMLF